MAGHYAVQGTSKHFSNQNYAYCGHPTINFKPVAIRLDVMFEFVVLCENFSFSCNCESKRFYLKKIDTALVTFDFYN